MIFDDSAIRSVHIQQIRTFAMQLVGPCNDYQITYVARHAGVVRDVVTNLETLEITQLLRLAAAMRREMFPGRA
jgi:hypothetical protein